MLLRWIGLAQNPSENPSSALTAHNRHRVTKPPQPASPPPTDQYVPPGAQPPLRHHKHGPNVWPSERAGPQPLAEPVLPARHPPRQPTERPPTSKPSSGHLGTRSHVKISTTRGGSRPLALPSATTAPIQICCHAARTKPAVRRPPPVRTSFFTAIKARAEPDRVSGRRALTATPFGARCSGQEDRKGSCCFRLAEQGDRCRLQGRFPGVGQARGCWVIPSPRVCGLKRFAGDGRTGSIRRNGHAGIGGHELHDPRRP